MDIKVYNDSLINIFGAENLQNPASRLAIVRQMADLAQSPTIIDSEFEIVQLVFEELSLDSLLDIRIEIAKAVCLNPKFSRHLILKLAHDCVSVAQHVLCYSNKLSSVDLVDYITQGDVEKQLAIANRLNLPGEVSLSLIEHGSDIVVGDLIKNSTANLSAHNLRQIYINFGVDPQTRELLLNRADLSADLRELIAYDVSKQLENFAINSNWLNEKQATNVAKKSYEIAVIKISNGLSNSEMQQYIQSLSEEERLTSSLILRSITTGYMKFFEHSLSYLTGLPIKKLQSLLHNPNILTRNALFSRSKLPSDIYPILALSVDVYKALRTKFDPMATNSQHEFSIEMIKNVTENYHQQNDVNQAYLQRVLDCYYLDISQKYAA